MKKCSVAALIISGVPFYANGAEALIVGQGQVRSSPDFVELSITVDSKCYPSIADARKVNDEAARKIVDFLNGKIKKKDAYNTVVTSGGYTSAYQTYYQNKYFCEDTFQKQNVITFRTQDLEHFESLFNEIQNMAYKELAHSAPNVIESAISYVSMGNPTPGISNEQRTKLEKQAVDLSYKDAKEKLNALFGEYKVLNLKLTNASELPPDQPIPMRQQRMAPMAMMAGAARAQAERAPVQFDEQEINKTMYFIFSFDDINLAN